MTNAFLAVDGNNLLMRAIHALHHRRGMDDPVMATGATVDLFIAMLSRRVREERPSRIIVAWDDTRGNWRTERYPDYKGNRAQAIDPDAKGSAFAAAKTFCHAAGIPNIAAPGAEADDVISWFWAGAKPKFSDEFLILSDDRDYAQLLGDSPMGVPTFQLKPSDDTRSRVTAADVAAKWGCMPHEMAKLKALMGDSGDNIPGLPGIGPKKALKMLQRADGDLTRVTIELPKAATRELTETERNDLTLYYDLVNLSGGEIAFTTPPRWIPVPASESTEGAMGELLDEFKLERVRSQLLAGELWMPRQDYGSNALSELLGQG